MLRQTSINKYYDIEDFEMPDTSTFISVSQLREAGCKELENSIVLMGHLGPENDDRYLIESTGGVYSTVIIARLIRQILSGKLSKSVEPK